MPDTFAHHPPYARWAHILLRVFAGAIIVQHGCQKLFGVLGGVGGGTAAQIGTIFWFAGIIETVGGILLIVGLFTRVAAFVMSGELAVAYFKVHFSQGFWPVLNRGELAVILSFVFLYFAATGAGAFSLDYIRSRRPKRVMES